MDKTSTGFGSSLRSSGRERRGVTIIESVMALALFATVMSLVAQTLIGVGRQRQVTQRRSLAIQEAANTMEKIAALSWKESTTDALASWPLSEAARRALPGAALNISVTLGHGLPRRKRVRVEIGWTESGQRVTPVSLVVWKHLIKERN